MASTSQGDATSLVMLTGVLAEHLRKIHVTVVNYKAKGRVD